MKHFLHLLEGILDLRNVILQKLSELSMY